MAVTKVTAATFTQVVLESELPVVVDFYADWCGPCHAVAPVIETLTHNWEGKVRFVKLNIDTSPEIAETYRVFSIPTIVLFDGGQRLARTVGAKPPQAIERDLGLAGVVGDPARNEAAS